jgi:MarR family transcriptional regulator, organic hydroperoxide resistance regulator
METMSFESHIYYRVERVSRMLNRVYEPRLGKYKLTPNDILILSALFERDGVTASYLAERYGFEVTTMIRLIGRMHRAKLVERIADPVDKRALRLFLNKEVRRQLKGWFSEAEALEAEIAARLNPDEQNLLRNLLDKLDVLPRPNGKHKKEK